MNLTFRASLGPRNTLLFDIIFTQGQKVKYTNLQELEESAFLLVSQLFTNIHPCLFTGQLWPSGPHSSLCPTNLLVSLAQLPQWHHYLAHFTACPAPLVLATLNLKVLKWPSLPLNIL